MQLASKSVGWMPRTTWKWQRIKKTAKKTEVSWVSSGEGDAHPNSFNSFFSFWNGAKHSSWLLWCCFFGYYGENTFWSSQRKCELQLSVLRLQKMFWPLFENLAVCFDRASLWKVLAVSNLSFDWFYPGHFWKWWCEALFSVVVCLNFRYIWKKHKSTPQTGIYDATVRFDVQWC